MIILILILILIHGKCSNIGLHIFIGAFVLYVKHGALISGKEGLESWPARVTSRDFS